MRKGKEGTRETDEGFQGQLAQKAISASLSGPFQVEKKAQ